MLCGMGCPDTAGKLFSLIAKKYGTEELVDLWRLSGVDRSVLKKWRDKPDAATQAPARRHYARIFEGVPATVPALSPPAPLAPDILAALARIESLLTARTAKIDRIEGLLSGLLYLRDKGRLAQVLDAWEKDAAPEEIRAKAKRKAGGAA